MRGIKFLISISLVFTISLFFSIGSSRAESDRKENHCFTCHTNARKLIKITREIAKANEGKKGAATESEGEG
jgi:hypothetical protein